jgi:hypothetical protein
MERTVEHHRLFPCLSRNERSVAQRSRHSTGICEFDTRGSCNQTGGRCGGKARTRETKARADTHDVRCATKAFSRIVRGIAEFHRAGERTSVVASLSSSVSDAPIADPAANAAAPQSQSHVLMFSRPSVSASSASPNRPLPRPARRLDHRVHRG